MPTRSLSIALWKADDTINIACKTVTVRLPFFYIVAYLYLSLILSAIIAINSEFVGLPLEF